MYSKRMEEMHVLSGTNDEEDGCIDTAEDGQNPTLCERFGGIALCAIIVGLVGALMLLFSMRGRDGGGEWQPSSTGFWGENSTVVYLGNGCFWERQYDYVMIEQQAWGRPQAQVSSLVGYAGGKGVSSSGHVCYSSWSQGYVYAELGHAEVVAVTLSGSPAQQFQQLSDLAQNFFGSFSITFGRGFTVVKRPDPMDVGAEYPSLVGIPGGMNSPLYPAIAQHKPQAMRLQPGLGSDQEVSDIVFVMDSSTFPFHRGETYHQFHSNFFGAKYPTSYTEDLYQEQIRIGRIAPTGCPAGRHW